MAASEDCDGDDASSDGEVTGCRWPVPDWGPVAPYRAAVVPLDAEGEHGRVAAELYPACGRSDVLLFDDPAQSIGERFAENDLLGIPATVVVGNYYDETGEIEVEYADGRREFIDPDAVPERVAQFGVCKGD